MTVYSSNLSALGLGQHLSLIKICAYAHLKLLISPPIFLKTHLKDLAKCLDVVPYEEHECVPDVCYRILDGEDGWTPVHYDYYKEEDQWEQMY